MVLIIDFLRNPYEDEISYIWRIGEAKSNGEIDATWEDIGRYINHEFRQDETEYRSESAYRKIYQSAKLFYESVFSKQIGGDSYIEQMREERQELYKVKTQVRDERNELNRKLRASSRLDSTLDALERTIASSGKERYLPTAQATPDGETDIVCCLSDIHYGIEFDSYTGKYNSDIAKERILKYASELVKIGKRHKSKDIYVAMLGDQISGNCHPSISVENRENVIEQIMGVSEIISDFLYEVASYFDNVHVVSVGGNHSRIQPKDMAVKDERLDNLIIWYLQCNFKHMADRVHITPVKENIDSTLALINVRGNDYVAVHGDYDPFTDAGIAKLVMWLGKKPYAVLAGHMHTHFYKETSVVGVQSGSMCGSGDDYTVERRLRGKPSQAACVVNEEGIVTAYPVRL